MPCDTRLKPRQTISQRAAEIRKVTEKLNQGLTTGRISVKIGPKGSIAFVGISDSDRDGVTDACAYRRILASGSSAAKLALQRAELLAGTKINLQTVATGIHSHDGGQTWHDHKG